MTSTDRAWAEAEIARAGDAPGALRAVYDELVERVGAKDASALWWSVFGSSDASET